MFESVMTVVWFLLAITVLVAVHEFGHFSVARLCGVKVLRFSIGFGRILWRFSDKRGTEFALSAIPLGGYVKMLDERAGDVDEHERQYEFTRKHPFQKILIAIAGPAANFILAFFLYWLLFLQGTIAYAPVIGEVRSGSLADVAGIEPGQEVVAIDGIPVSSRKQMQLALIDRIGESGELTFELQYWNSDFSTKNSLVYESVVELEGWMRGEEQPDLLEGLGVSFYVPPAMGRVAQVIAGSRAEEGGMQAGDTIQSIDGFVIDGDFDWLAYIAENPEKTMLIVVEREGAEVNLSISPKRVVLENGKVVGRLGFAPLLEPFPEAMIRIEHYSIFAAVGEAFKEMWTTTRVILLSLKKIIVGEISTKSLSGPIGIAQVASDSAQSGLVSFFNFLGYLSLMLGVMNLLPIPVLDGGHVVYSIIEWVKGSPLSEKVQALGVQLGMVVLLGVMVIAFYNDLLRL